MRVIRRRSVLVAVLLTVGVVVHVTSARAANFAQAQWRSEMQHLETPGTGCFTGAYPDVAWRRVSCVTAPLVMQRPESGTVASSLPDVQRSDALSVSPRVAMPTSPVGDGIDYVAKINSGSIASATGSFPYVSSGATETGTNPYTNTVGPNTFTLQINAQPILGLPACAKAVLPAICEVWQQFIYDAGNHALYIQYWLLNYGSNAKSFSCPSNWTKSGNSCVENSMGIILSGTPPTIPTLENVAFTGTVQPNGDDSVMLAYGNGTVDSVSAYDSVLDLGGHWQDAEFAIVGDGNLSEAKFSPGTTIDVKTSINDGATAAPVCEETGYTGETNNLGFAAAPSLAESNEPAIETQQSIGGSKLSCSAAAQSAITVTNPGAQTSNVGSSSKLQMNGTDGTSGQTLKWSATGLPAGMSISAAGLITGIPSAPGMASVTVTATDGTGANYSTTFLWKTVDVITIMEPGSSYDVGEPVDLQIVGTDSGGEALTYSAYGLPDGLSISASGLVTGTPTTAGGFYDYINATDASGATANIGVAWHISPAPAATSGTQPSSTNTASRLLTLRDTVRRRELLLTIKLGNGPKRRLQCSLIRVYKGRRIANDRWVACSVRKVYKNLSPGRYRLRIRGTGGEVTRFITIR